MNPHILGPLLAALLWGLGALAFLGYVDRQTARRYARLKGQPLWGVLAWVVIGLLLGVSALVVFVLPPL